MVGCIEFYDAKSLKGHTAPKINVSETLKSKKEQWNSKVWGAFFTIMLSPVLII